MTINVIVNEATVSNPTINTAEVTGGGALPAKATEPTTISPEPAPFALNDFAMSAFDGNGLASLQAGGHPQALDTTLDLTTLESEINHIPSYGPSQELKDVLVDLPPGLVGNPLATPRCPQHDLLTQTGKTACPLDTRVGTLVFEAFPGAFRESENPGNLTTAVYNIEPEAGYPAEFGFSYLGKPVFLYASLFRQGSEGYGLRVASPGIPSLETIGVGLVFFGNPTQRNGVATEGVPFFTNPVDCGGGGAEARAEVDSWINPGVFFSLLSDTYPSLEECNKLQFAPTLSVTPETTRADEPSGYGFDVQNPQYEGEAAPGTPEIRNVSVSLPPGVSVSPAAADGLGACPAEGPSGINIGSDNVTPQGRDLGDPWATELGGPVNPAQGYVGAPGGESPYDDGLWHTAPGHCPANSTVASVEVESPLLTKPLTGHLYLAQPGCGGDGPNACTPRDAADGNLLGVYLEVSGSGAIVKLRGSAKLNVGTGQLHVTFRENPQLPFSVLRVQTTGGPRASLANPPSCGEATTSADLTPWSAPTTPDAALLSPFAVDWTGGASAGQPGACPGTTPFAPGFNVGMTESLAAGSFSPLSVTLSREDRQQYLSQVSVTTPPGLLGMLSNVTLCEEPQAARGTCPEASRIGTATAAAGAGSHPYWVTGQVYLTTGYRGAPFGLTIVVPAKAGPFDLGNVIVRSAISVDPHTAQITVTSDPLPQIVDGIPLRVQKVNVVVNHEHFTFNPTNCEAHQSLGTVSGSQGAIVNVSSPFTAAGCRNLPFSPQFVASTQSHSSKADGASLDVKLLYKPGQANIRSAFVKLPKALPARLTTLQHACPDATFQANPATCPAGSLIGIAKATTPVLPVPLAGPAYLVSHGGAAFPDLVFILQGDGVSIEVRGATNIVNGVTSNNITNAPDAPISTFELILPKGPHSALTTALLASAHGNLCGSKLVMPTTLTGQNGLQVKQNTRISVTGCPNVLSLLSHRVAHGLLSLTVSLPAAGRLTVSGRGIRRVSKTVGGQETVTVTVHAQGAAALTTRVGLSFVEAQGKRISKALRVTFPGR